MHGASYTLHYHARSEPIQEPAKRGSPVVLWSDKHWLSSQGFYGRPDMARREAQSAGKYKTIQDRIAETVSRLIKKKLIVSPAELTQRKQIASVAHQRHIEQAEAEDHKRLEMKARETVREMQLPDFGGNVNDTIVAQIVEAMKWARSNT